MNRKEGKVDGNPPELSDKQMNLAVEIACKINDVLDGIDTHTAVWSVGFILGACGFFETKSNPDIEESGVQFIADAATIGVNEMNQLLEDDENGNDDDDTPETRH